MIATPAIICLKCLSLIYNRQLCACKNVGVIVDDDGHLNLYVKEIKTTQRALLFHTGNYIEIRRALLEPFSKALYAPYSFKDEPIYLKPLAPRRREPRRTSTEYNMDLINALDRHMLITSDGKERFKRTALNNPKG